MTIQQKIYDKITSATTKPKEKAVLKLVKSDIQRERFKDVPDNIVLGIIRAHISGAKECCKYLDHSDHEALQDCEFCINVLEDYLPTMATKEEIECYIKDSIDLSQYNNRMQAMRPIMQHFGTTADGNVVKSVLLSIV